MSQDYTVRDASKALAVQSADESVPGMLALVVVRQNLNDAAFADLSVPAAINHVLEFGL